MLYCKKYKIDNKNFFIVCSEDKLVYVGVNEKNFEQYRIKYFSSKVILENMEKTVYYANQLEDYFFGKRKVFEFDIFDVGTTFQKEVWQAISSIKFGEVVTYKSIAEKINKPKAIRAVATAIAKNPLLIFIPCHRVIGTDGALHGYSAGLEMKRNLLVLEKKLA